MSILDWPLRFIKDSTGYSSSNIYFLTTKASRNHGRTGERLMTRNCLTEGLYSSNMSMRFRMRRFGHDLRVLAMICQGATGNSG
ncbi:unnamed protein product [Prunus armeniaca]|uniref:Uncharacterized protein n=1 Tax=Prunus armeniaca TaxID=36596 RepID=A0A6J5X026_PRUAR|nr:unnamed protein product [Prunus armeniaca]